MKRKNTRFLKGIGIAAAIVAVCVTPVIADEVSDLQDEKNKIESEVDSLEAQLTEILTDIDEMEKKAAKLGDDIDKGKDDLEVAQEKQADQYADMKLRVQYMYENKEVKVADIFLSSDSFSDVLNKTEYFQKIYEYDRKELDELDKTTKEIQSINAKLEADLAELEKQQEKALAKQDELNELIESKQSEVSDLDQRIAKVQEEIARKAAEEEARRLAEEEAKRREEEEANRVAEIESQTMQEAVTSQSGGEKSTSQNSGSGNDASSGNDTASNSSDSQAQTSSSQASTSNNNSNNNRNNNVTQNKSNDNKARQPAPSSSGKGSSIVSTAYNYIGVPYVYGGSSPRGFDCSGLVQYVYRQNGISLPRTSGSQAGVGRGVSLSDAQPGDIVCYPGHVAIYIGGGQVIHAPYPGRKVEVANANMMRVTTVRRVAN